MFDGDDAQMTPAAMPTEATAEEVAVTPEADSVPAEDVTETPAQE